MFANVNAFRHSLNEYVMQWGFPINRKKNEKARITAICDFEGCPQRVHASPMPDGITFKIKTRYPDHTCVRSEKTKASSKWMAKMIVHILRGDPNVRPQLLKDELIKHGMSTSEMQLFRAKKAAMEMIDDNDAQSYCLLPKYGNMILSTNPGSIVKMEFTWPEGVDGVPTEKDVCGY